MAKLFLLIICFSLMLAVQSCFFSGCENAEFTSSEKEWLNHFELGEKFIFKGDRGNCDTLVLIELENYYSACNQIETSSYRYNYYKLVFSTSRKQIDGDDNIEIYFTKRDNNKPCNMCFYIFDLWWCGDAIDSDILHCIKGINSNSEGSHNIHSFKWSKKEGLTEYSWKGEMFYLQR